MRYKHCEISDNYKTIYRKDPISGREWSEHIVKKGVHVLGGRLAERSFANISTAKEAIDFDWEVLFGKFKYLGGENENRG